MKRRLSKSQINTFRQCPLKWKLHYIDGIRSLGSPAMNRGSTIHKKIENFYKNVKIVDNKIEHTDEDLVHLINFDNRRLKDITDIKNHFYPLFQELDITNEEMGVRGIIDAVFLNDDGKLIIIDWKTGQYNKSKFDDYRMELAIYAELLRKSDKIKDVEVGYWGIYFVDKDKLFFEPIDEKWIAKIYKIIDKVRSDIDEGKFPMRPSFFCRWCQFAKDGKCGGNDVNI